MRPLLYVLFELLLLPLQIAAVPILWRGVRRNAAAGIFATSAAHSAVAFDYLSEELLEARPPFEGPGRLLRRGMRVYTNEELRWGLSTRSMARHHLASRLAAHGLRIETFEPLERPEHPFGGLVLACPAPPKG